jgi:hypothetical protein
MPWQGVGFKIGEADFFLSQMREDITPLVPRPETVVFAPYMTVPGTIVWNPWQQRFYYHLDAFLAATRSVPDIIQAAVGLDRRPWVNALPPAEIQRRRTFQGHFKPLYVAFSDLPMSRARVVTLHRTGVPPVEVEIHGLWGVYTGTPNQAVPIAESPSLPPDLSFPVMSTPGLPVQPELNDFTLIEHLPGGGTRPHPLFPACEDYLRAARQMVEDARRIAQQVHGAQPLTAPPNY